MSVFFGLLNDASSTTLTTQNLSRQRKGDLKDFDRVSDNKLFLTDGICVRNIRI